MVEKILAKASGRKKVTPGEVVVANVDLMIMHDLSANFVMKVSSFWMRLLVGECIG